MTSTWSQRLVRERPQSRSRDFGEARSKRPDIGNVSQTHRARVEQLITRREIDDCSATRKHAESRTPHFAPAENACARGEQPERILLSADFLLVPRSMISLSLSLSLDLTARNFDLPAFTSPPDSIQFDPRVREEKPRGLMISRRKKAHGKSVTRTLPMHFALLQSRRLI